MPWTLIEALWQDIRPAVPYVFPALLFLYLILWGRLITPARHQDAINNYLARLADRDQRITDLQQQHLRELAVFQDRLERAEQEYRRQLTEANERADWFREAAWTAIRTGMTASELLQSGVRAGLPDSEDRPGT